MEPRGRDLLRAEAKFLGDYCGEEAVRRWHETLSSGERERLVPNSTSVEPDYRAFAGAVQRLLRAMAEAVTTQLRRLLEALVAMCATVIGRTPRSFGHQTP